MCWLETIQGDCIWFALNIEGEMLGCALEYSVWSIIWMLEWFPDGVMTDKNMCACGEAGRDV